MRAALAANVLFRDLNIITRRQDGHRTEVIAKGLLLRGGVQPAVDSILSSRLLMQKAARSDTTATLSVPLSASHPQTKSAPAQSSWRPAVPLCRACHRGCRMLECRCGSGAGPP